MTRDISRRRVIFAEDDASIRNILNVLLGGEPCAGRDSQGEEYAFTIITRNQFDAVLLDLQCATPPAEEGPIQIKDVCPILVGRVLVITGEVTSPETMEIIARHCLPHGPLNRPMHDLWNRLRTIVSHSGSPKVVH